MNLHKTLECELLCRFFIERKYFDWLTDTYIEEKKASI